MELEHDILTDIAAEVEGMSQEELREELRRAQATEVKRKERQKEYNASPEAQARRKAYYDDPDKKEARKAYQKKRAAKQKLILARAAELGIDKEVDEELGAEEGLGAG